MYYLLVRDDANISRPYKDLRSVRTLLKKKILSICLVISIFLVVVIPVNATEPIFSLSVMPDKPAYSISEDVKLTVNFEWKYLTQNHTVLLALFFVNGTLIQNLDTLADINGNGTFSKTYVLSGLTNKVGVFNYVVKALEGELVIATAEFSISVQTESYALIIAWQDASGDRVIDPNELVLFEIFVQWNFVNGTRNLGLYRDEEYIGSVNITTPAGSTKLSYQTAFEQDGVYSIVFALKYANGTIATEKIVTLTVGNPNQQASLTDLLTNNLYVVIGAVVFIAIVVAIVYIVKK